MKGNIVKKLLISVAGVVLGLTLLHGQDRGVGLNFQVLGPAGGGGALDAGFGNQVVKGKPFSASEERRFMQILGDGNRIETNQINKVFRDGQGRTRVEDMNGIATINDPVAGTRVELNPTAKTARITVPPPALAVLRTIEREMSINTAAGEKNATKTGGKGARGAAKGGTPEATETLRPQLVNGVMAQGTRSTITIPRGQIGNDREIRVVTERWVSDSLQTLIKSTNSDPRFGDTTYQLTGIVEREPDAYLFQIPGDYRVVNPPGRGGGGKGPAPAGVGVPAPGGGRSATPGGARKGGAAKSNIFGEPTPPPVEPGKN